MPLTKDVFTRAFEKIVEVEKLDWRVNAFHGCNGRLYPFGTDTKVLSTVFEALAAPIVHVIAEEHGYQVEASPQTVYPDFTLTMPSRAEGRIAIDIKTTYRKTPTSRVVFTLGSYTSFLRNGTKNILHPYSQYTEHWIIGFIYTRRKGVSAKVHTIVDKDWHPECPYEGVEYFIQDKFRVGGLRKASGNTKNIGSFRTSDVEQFKDGNGPFKEYGKEVFDAYWRYYPHGSPEGSKDVAEFLAWARENGH
jgi:hypothetical protein